MIRRSPFRSIALVAVAATAFACGSPATSTTSTTAPTVAAPTMPAFSLDPNMSFGPGFSFELPSVDKALEAVLPDEIAGEAVSKSSVGGETFLGTAGSEELTAVLQALGKTPADLTAAVGGNSKAFLIAFKINGVPAGQFLDSFVAAASGDSGVQLTDVTVGGKQAKRFSDNAGTTMYLYLTGDTIVTVSPITQDQAVLDEIFSKLP